MGQDGRRKRRRPQATPALEQSRASRRLDVGQPLRDGRLRDVQRARGSGQAAVPGDGQQHLEVAQPDTPGPLRSRGIGDIGRWISHKQSLLVSAGNWGSQ
jgi:hypothetical protein